MADHAIDASAGTLDVSRDAADGTAGMLQSIGRGASDLAASAGDFLSRTVYTASYAVSYGVVLPAMLVARAVPADNVLVHGLAEGAQAARDRAFRLGWGAAGQEGHGEMDEAESHDSGDEGSGDELEGSARSGSRRRGGRHRDGRRASH